MQEKFLRKENAACLPMPKGGGFTPHFGKNPDLEGGEILEFVVNSNTIISLATLITALGAIFGVIRWCLKFVERNDKQDKELRFIKNELKLLCYGQTACLKGLKEQGCDGPVKDALETLEKHLNEAAHND